MRFQNLILASALFAVASIASAQDSQNMFMGAGHPLTLKADGLADNFHAVQIKTAGGGGNGLMDMLMSPMMMLMGALGGAMGGQQTDGPPVPLLTALDLTWTTGEVQTFYGKTYLVSYKLDVDMDAVAKAKEITDANLRLSFVATDSITSVTPRPDITPAAYMKMLKTPIPKPAATPTAPPEK